MILGVCPNPSVDITFSIDSLCVHKTNRATKAVTTYSGKAINTLKTLAVLDEKCLATGFMPKNDKIFYENELQNLGVECDFLDVCGSVRKNIKLIEKCGDLTEINTQGDIVSNNDCDKLIKKIEKLTCNANLCFISGSLPSGADDEYYGKLSRAVNEECIKIIDTHNDMLLYALKYGADLIKPNYDELCGIAKKELNTKADLFYECDKLLDLGAKLILLSLGKDGAILYGKNVKLYAKAPTVKVLSPVGAGDSMIAACAANMKNGVNNERLLKCAIGAGTAATMTCGTNPFNLKDYNEICKLVIVEKL